MSYAAGLRWQVFHLFVTWGSTPTLKSRFISEKQINKLHWDLFLAKCSSLDIWKCIQKISYIREKILSHAKMGVLLHLWAKRLPPRGILVLLPHAEIYVEILPTMIRIMIKRESNDTVAYINEPHNWRLFMWYVFQINILSFFRNVLHDWYAKMKTIHQHKMWAKYTIGWPWIRCMQHFYLEHNHYEKYTPL